MAEDIPLKEYIESRLAGHEICFTTKIKAVEETIRARFDEVEKATVLARESMDSRLSTMNEFRNTLRDQIRQLYFSFLCYTKY